MKKSILFAMAMALGVTASAYAANPFSDVPAGHWAYDSISKLAAAGVIEGYGDDTFRGDRLMTRYEMAQIVAKAMAKGANVDKLAAEFADELDALGVRVAALEKKSDNVKITGQVRYRWREGSPNGIVPGRQRNHDLRTRLWFNGQVNDNWKYVGMIQNIQDFTNDQGDENGGAFTFQRAYLEGRLGGTKITAGRYHAHLVGGDSDVYENRVDAVKGEYGDKLKVAAWYGKPTALNGAFGPYSRFAGARLAYDADKYDVYVEYDKFAGTHRGAAAGPTRDVFGLGANGRFGDFGLEGLYLHGKTKNAVGGKKDGFTIKASYKGADRNKPGSWGLAAKYYDQGNHTYFGNGNHGANLIEGAFMPIGADGFRGWRFGGNYTVAKNMVAGINYFDLRGKGAGARKAKTVSTQLMVTF
jgi:hypothetical protein